MDEVDPVALFVGHLNRLDVRYMVTGSVAAIAYGQPRLTHDVDVVIELGKSQVGLLLLAFPAPEFYCPPHEVVRIEIERPNRGHFNIIHHETGFKADMYPAGEDALHAWGMARRRRIMIGAESVELAPPEYVILRKLEYYREGGSEKHVLDIRSMLDASAELIDRLELERRITRRGLDEAWRQVSSAGEGLQDEQSLT